MSERDVLPYGHQWIDEDDIEAVAAVLRGDFLTTGPMVERFERALCDRTGAGSAVAVSSGTAALHAAYFAAGIGPGDEVITTPLTFAATANAALYLGATVRFADVRPDDGTMDPAALEAAVTDRTRLVVPVDYAGHPADYDAIAAIAGDRGAAVVADGSHSLGATYKGRPCGTLAAATTLSFHPVKPITTAEGGAVLTDDAGLGERARRFRTHGIVRGGQDEGPWWQEMRDLGYNYRLSDVHCALGLSQLGKLDRFLARRRLIADAYTRGLAGVAGLELPVAAEHAEPGWHLYVVRVRDAAQRRPLFESLRAAGLGVQVHYVPVHYHPYYQRLGFNRGAFPAAEDYYARAISLPIFPAMTDADVQRVIDTVAEAVP